MLEVKLWSNGELEYKTCYFEDVSELETYLLNNYVSSIWKYEV